MTRLFINSHLSSRQENLFLSSFVSTCTVKRLITMHDLMYVKNKSGCSRHPFPPSKDSQPSAAVVLTTHKVYIARRYLKDETIFNAAVRFIYYYEKIDLLSKQATYYMVGLCEKLFVILFMPRIKKCQVMTDESVSILPMLIADIL